MAKCAPFSGTRRPNHTAVSPPGPGCHRLTFTPLGMITGSDGRRQSRAVVRLTAAKRPARSPAAVIASWISSTIGVCSVVSIGSGSGEACEGKMYGFRLLLCTTS